MRAACHADRAIGSGTGPTVRFLAAADGSVYLVRMARAHSHIVHDHVLHEGADLAAAARAALLASGEQWTPMRSAVFDALCGFDRPASAYDIAEAVSAAEGRRIAANSIYRILDLFTAANLARRVESANAYIVNAHPGCRHDCIFLVCDACGQAIHIDDDRLTSGIRTVATQAGFAAVRPVIEVRGRCGACAPATT